MKSTLLRSPDDLFKVVRQLVDMRPARMLNWTPQSSAPQRTNLHS